MKRLALAATLVVALVAGAAARQDPAPTGTGVIAGRVTDAATGKPLHASVFVTQVPVGYVNKNVSTDDEGKFEAVDLPAATYVVSALAADHVKLAYGQKKPSGPTGNIELADAERFTKADIALPRTSAIEGVVVDDSGQPAAHVVVQATTVMYVAGRTRMTSAGAGRAAPTDAQGSFRVEGLAPGDYYLLAVSGPFARDQHPGFAPTYFPGTTMATVAQAVHVEAGQDVTSLRFPMTAASFGTISGQVTLATGEPVKSGGLVLAPLQGGDVRAEIAAPVPMGPDGKFTVRYVPYGQYVLQTLTGPGRDNVTFGSVTVTIDREELKDISIVAAPGATYHGRFEFNDTGAPPAVGQLRLLSVPLDFVNGPFVGFGGPPQKVNPDLTFEVSNLFGIGLLRAIAPAPWTVKRITIAGEDVTDAPLDFRKGDRDDVVVTLTTRVTTVTGTVTDRDKPIGNCGVVIFSTDAGKWTPMSRYVAMGRSDGKGTFSIRGLPPGSYVAVAVAGTVGPEVMDPQVLRKMVPFGTAVSLVEGEMHAITLKLATMPK